MVTAFRTARGRCRPLAGLLLTFVVLVAVGGCGDDDAGPADDPSAEPGTSEGSITAPSPAPEPLGVEPLAAARPEPPAPGRARLVLGGSVDAELDLTRCEIDDAAAPEGDEPVRQVAAEATGQRADGRALLLEVSRFVAPGDATTITDTVTVTEGPADRPARVLQAQRFEVDGLVSDGREPGATSPLLQVGDATVEGSARFAPPGNFADDGGLVEGAVALTCSS